MIELCCEYLSVWCIGSVFLSHHMLVLEWIYDLKFLRKSLIETGTISEVLVFSNPVAATLKFQISRLFWSKIFLTFTQFQIVDSH